MGTENKPEVTLWLLRLEYFLSKFFRFKIIASLFIFYIPWGIITSLAATYCSFYNAPLIIQLWSIISFFILFFVLSIGFCGILLLMGVLNNIFTADLFFDIFHPDKFGGFSNFSSFSVKISLYFSSGSLVSPLAYEAIKQTNSGNTFLTNIIYILSGFYLMAIILSFIIPIYNINKYVDGKKKYLISQSWNKLNKMINDLRECKDLNLKQGIDISMYYYFYHSKLLKLKDYPWDVKVLMEFGSSFVLPIPMGILKIYYQ